MKRSNEIEKILDECLERIFAGETVEDCLKDYPDHAAELKPLLETVMGVTDAVDVSPRPEFREQAARDFQAAVRDMKPARSGGFFSLHRWAVGALSAVVVVLLAGGGTVAAANNSLPDSPLYSVKLATESVRVAFAFSDEHKAELYAEFANKRVDEIVTMAEAGNIEALNRATDNLNGHLIAMADVYGADGSSHTFATGGDSATGSGEEQQMLASAPAPSSQNRESTLPETTITIQPAPTFTLSATDESMGGSGEQKALAVPELPPGAEDEEGLDPGLKESVMADAASNSIKLQEAQSDAPESIREALQRAIEIAMFGYGVAIDYIE